MGSAGSETAGRRRPSARTLKLWPSARVSISCRGKPRRKRFPRNCPAGNRPAGNRPAGNRPAGPRQEPLWREVLGQRLRALRLEQRTLAETAGRAGISPQYLSEIERGRKEPSSEMIAALAGALGTTLIGLAEQVAGDLRRQQAISLARASVPRAAPVSRGGPGHALLAA